MQFSPFQAFYFLHDLHDYVLYYDYVLVLINDVKTILFCLLYISQLKFIIFINLLSLIL
jgi:hypothetical protein